MREPPPAFDFVRPWGYYAPHGLYRKLIAGCRALPARIRILYRIALLLRRPVKYGAHHPLDVESWGLRLRLLPRGSISEAKMLFTPQYFDLPEREWLAAHVPADGVFLDIGANAGAYSFYMRSARGAHVRILAVEPDPEMQGRIRFNIAANAITNIELCPIALSDHAGEATLELNQKQRGQNALREGGSSAAATVTVALETLEGLLKSHGVTHVDAMKIDIEGYEPRVLGHFFTHTPSTLWPKAIVAEYKGETGAALRQIFADAGYTIVGRTKFNWLLGRS